MESWYLATWLALDEYSYAWMTGGRFTAAPLTASGGSVDNKTAWMMRVAAGVVMAWFGWQLVAASILSQVNLSFQNKALQDGLKACQAKGISSAPAQ